MNRVLLLLISSFLWVTTLSAQEIISGTVVDGKNEPFPGVRIEVVDRQETTTTDIDGKFSLDLPVTVKKIRVSYPGYKPQIFKVKPNMVIRLGNGWESRTSGYRGFFELQGGVGFGGKVNVQAGDLDISNIGSPIMFGWTTTHGYQINPNLFVGLGIGENATLLYADTQDYSYQYGDHKFDSLIIPVFADARWDFGLQGKTAPFVDLKLGYQICHRLSDDWHSSYASGNYLTLLNQNTGGLLIMPTIGLRTKVRNRCGFNIGLSYNLMVPKKLTATYSYHLPDWNNPDRWDYDETHLELGRSVSGVLLLNFGFDF